MAPLAHGIPKSTAFIEQWKSEQRAAGKCDTPDWRWVPYPAISPHLKRAVLVSEDINFLGHHGFEVAEIETALKDAIDEHDIPNVGDQLRAVLARRVRKRAA